MREEEVWWVIQWPERQEMWLWFLDIDFLLEFVIVLMGLVRAELQVGWNSCAADP